MTTLPDAANPLSLFDSDPEVAEEKFLALRRQIIRYCEWRGAQDAEDLADEAFSRAFRRLQAGAAVESIGHYVFGIARLVLLEASRQAKSRRLEEPLDAASSHAAERALESSDSKLLLRKTLAMLSEHDRLLLTRYFLDDDRKAVAEKVGLSPEALRVRVHVIMKKLRRRMLEQQPK